MKRRTPRLTSDGEAEAFLASDLSGLDFSQFKLGRVRVQEGEVDWIKAVDEVIEKAKERNASDRLEFLDFLVTSTPTHISIVDKKSAELKKAANIGAIRDNRFINPVTKIIHGKERRASAESWLEFKRDTRMYAVNRGFAEAWKKARGL
jgi:hypothetical protein